MKTIFEIRLINWNKVKMNEPLEHKKQMKFPQRDKREKRRQSLSWKKVKGSGLKSPKSNN